jgi:hypothetical protein
MVGAATRRRARLRRALLVTLSELMNAARCCHLASLDRPEAAAIGDHPFRSYSRRPLRIIGEEAGGLQWHRPVRRGPAW